MKKKKRKEPRGFTVQVLPFYCGFSPGLTNPPLPCQLSGGLVSRCWQTCHSRCLSLLGSAEPNLGPNGLQPQKSRNAHHNIPIKSETLKRKKQLTVIRQPRVKGRIVNFLPLESPHATMASSQECGWTLPFREQKLSGFLIKEAPALPFQSPAGMKTSERRSRGFLTFVCLSGRRKRCFFFTSICAGKSQGTALHR